jgi:hypothetical protein
MPPLKKKKQEEQQEENLKERQGSTPETVEGKQPVTGNEIQTDDHGSDTENLPVEGSGSSAVANYEETDDLSALVDQANDGDEDWTGQDYIPQIWVDDDEHEGCIVDSDGEVVVEADGHMHAAILRSHQRSMKYQLEYDEWQELKQEDPEAENPVVCRSSNGLTPDTDIDNPLCGTFADGDNPCQKKWSKSKKRFTASCSYKNEGYCMEQTCCLIADYSKVAQEKFEDKELFANCMSSEDFSPYYPTKELYWLTIGGFGWTTFAPFKKMLGKALTKFNRMKIVPGKIKKAGVLIFRLSSTREHKNSHGKKQWCFEYGDITPVSEYMGDVHLAVTEFRNETLGKKEGDAGYAEMIRGERHWVGESLKDIADYAEAYMSVHGDDEEDEVEF